MSPVGWRAHKQKRRTASTLAAETVVTTSGMGALEWVRAFWGWMTNFELRLQNWEQEILRQPALILTDCYNRLQTLQQLWSSSSKADKRTSIDLAILREALTRDATKMIVRSDGLILEFN